MTIAEWLDEATSRLNKLETARLDAEVLLCAVLSMNKAQAYAHPELTIQPDELRMLDAKLERRLKHEPIAYIVGKQEFYGRDFTVNTNVLIPRPESESIIELTKKHASQITNMTVADIGTGSGALGVTLALELPDSVVHLHDIDPRALALASSNAKKHNTQLRCTEADLLEPNYGPYDVIVANLPYVPDTYDVNKAATFEPALALYGGEDGLELYRRMFRQLATFAWRPQFICTESLEFQHSSLADIAKDYGYKVLEKDGLAQLFTPLE